MYQHFCVSCPILNSHRATPRGSSNFCTYSGFCTQNMGNPIFYNRPKPAWPLPPWETLFYWTVNKPALCIRLSLSSKAVISQTSLKKISPRQRPCSLEECLYSQDKWNIGDAWRIVFQQTHGLLWKSRNESGAGGCQEFGDFNTRALSSLGFSHNPHILCPTNWKIPIFVSVQSITGPAHSFIPDLKSYIAEQSVLAFGPVPPMV